VGSNAIALQVQPPQQQPGVLDQYGKMLTLQSLLSGQRTQQLQQQGLQQENVARDQENQARGLQLQDAQTLRSLSAKHVEKDDSGAVTGFDFDGLMKDASAAGVSPQTLSAMQNQRAETVKNLAAASDAVRNGEQAKNKAAYEALESVRSVQDPAQKQQAYTQALGSLQKQGVDVSTLPRQVPGDDGLTAFEAGLGAHAQVIADAKTAAETNASNAKAQLDRMEAQQKGSPLAALEANPSAMAGDKLPAVMGYLQSKIADPNADPADVARATRLMSVAKTTQQVQLGMEASKKATDQAIADGDPAAAAKLLVSGTVAPSQLISSRKPEFAQKAFTLASQMQPGWNAQQAEAGFKAASSSGQVAFFGSAKSLIDKGGTLDQLADAAKDIPQGQIPVFNSIADAMKASTGSGPVAKYASIALGVADDYSKVMGGGQGSDASRNSALQLISAKQSPEQRAASIEGIRGAVGSQASSRIGNNPVLQKMYGTDLPQSKANAGPPPGATHTAPGSDEKMHYTNAQGQDLGVVQ
jgi:hypothetical protein